MRYISTFSGIEAASVAWEPLGWEPVAFSEVDEFPSAVLAERFPDVPNLGDITQVDWSRYRGAVDLVVGGSPCQSFSIAGNRTGLEGASGLMWEYVRCVREVRPRWFVWENVPGALSSAKGEDFACLLRSMDELGYGLAWRVLDAQFFGVAQRRRRVFLVGSLGDRRAADVLFEPESLLWDSPSSRAKREALTDGAFDRFERSIAANQRGELRYDGGDGSTVGAIPATMSGKQIQAVVCMMGDHGKAAVDVGVSGTLTAHDAKGAPIVSECLTPWDVQSRRIHIDSGSWPALYAGEGGGHGYVFTGKGYTEDNRACDRSRLRRGERGGLHRQGDACGHGYGRNTGEYSVRRLTPRECERLQGFPDDWTLIDWRGKRAPDGKRYKALGNSMCVNVMKWIGVRIDAVDKKQSPDEACKMIRGQIFGD